MIGGERVELAWYEPDHSPDNSFIYFPDHDTLMMVDIVNSGWVPSTTPTSPKIASATSRRRTTR
ncbi:MAG: hypothetical protein JOZ99_10675 [Actinobacteria bacterium]|nr:hypothetical protein [Actinomycetota bacterium]